MKSLDNVTRGIALAAALFTFATATASAGPSGFSKEPTYSESQSGSNMGTSKGVQRYQLAKGPNYAYTTQKYSRPTWKPPQARVPKGYRDKPTRSRSHYGVTSFSEPVSFSEPFKSPVPLSKNPKAFSR